MKMNAYLSFDGRCEAAFRFYETALQGKVTMMMRYKEAPPETCGPESEPHDEKAGERIMHARLVAGDAVLMGGDAPAPYYSKPQGICVSINVDTPAEADRVFGALAVNAGAKLHRRAGGIMHRS